MTELLHGQTTGKALRAYFNVYNGLSHTYPEYIIENAMMVELRSQDLQCTRQEECQIYYKDWLVGVQRLDILIAESVCLELKVKPALMQLDLAQILSYLKTLQLEVGLLLNFGSPKPEFRRVILTEQQLPVAPDSTAPEQADLLFPELAYHIVNGLFEVHRELGPGFIHRIYANACYREMMSRGLETKTLRRMAVLYRGKTIGDIRLGHLLIEGCVMVFPVAISDIAQIKPENLRSWMASQGIQLGILANFRASSLEPLFMRV